MMSAILHMLTSRRSRTIPGLQGWRGVFVPLLVLLPVLTGYSTVESLFGIGNGATVQKALVLICVAVAGVLVGFRLPPWQVFVILGIFAVALAIGAVMNVREAARGDTVLLRGAAGYAYAWSMFFVDWRRISPRSRALALGLSPIIAGIINLPLALFGHATFVRHEYTGALRLATGMPPAYLASLALFGVFGAAWLWTLRSSWGLWLAVVNLVICALTGTRGATLAAGLVFVALLIAAVRYQLPQWKIGLGAAAIGLIGGLLVFLPTFIQRSASTAHGAFTFSGRTEAWTYFLGRYQEHPWIGYGPGGATALAAESGNKTIERSFVSPHSAYISLLVDIGAPLFALFVVMFFMLFWRAWRESTVSFRAVIWVVAVSCIFYGAFDNLLNAAQSTVPLTLMLSMLAAPVAPVPKGITELSRKARRHRDRE